MTVAHASGSWPAPVTPIPKGSRLLLIVSGISLAIGGIAIILAVSVVTILSLAPADTGKVMVIGPSATRAGKTSVEVIDGPPGRWTVGWDRDLRPGQVIDVELSGSCRCKPREPIAATDYLEPIAVVAALFALLALAFRGAWRQHRLAQAMLRSQGALTVGATTVPVRTRPHFVGSRRLIVAFDLWTPDGGSPIGQAHLGPVSQLFDPRAAFLVVGDVHGQPALVSADNRQLVLLRGPIVGQADDPVARPVHPASGVMVRVLGWDRPSTLVSTSDGISMVETAPARYDPHMVAAAESALRRVRVLLLPTLALLVFAIVVHAPFFVAVIGPVLLAAAVRRWWMLNPLVDAVRHLDSSLSRRDARHAAATLFTLRAAKVLPPPVPEFAGAAAAAS